MRYEYKYFISHWDKWDQNIINIIGLKSFHISSIKKEVYKVHTTVSTIGSKYNSRAGRCLHKAINIV